jgi:nucleotide-binding universal stress UspA family protein
MSSRESRFRGVWLGKRMHLGLPSLLRFRIAANRREGNGFCAVSLSRGGFSATRHESPRDWVVHGPEMDGRPDCGAVRLFGDLPKARSRGPLVLGKIICGVDESDEARDAVRVAKSLARELGRRLVLVHAVRAADGLAVALPPYSYPHPTDDEATRRAAEQVLAGLVQDSGLAGSVGRRIETGDPATVLLRIAEDELVDLIVVGTRRRGLVASAILGSVSTAVVSRAPCPVVVVPPAARLGSGPVVCAVDDGSEAGSAARVARRLADQLGVDLLVAHAVATAPVPSASAVPSGPAEVTDAERRQAEELLAGLAFEHGLGTEVERRVAFGSEAEAISQLADEEDASFLVVGAHRRGALLSLIGGSVSFDLRTTSSRPTVVVPAGAHLPPAR